MNLHDIKTIKSVLGRHGFKFSKALGQNFLIDGDVCPAMASMSGCDDETLAIEIGPGIGVLTKELCKKAAKVIAVELDKRLIPVLAETLGEFDNLTVINDDVMKLDLKKLIEENKGDLKKVRICANLPYYITSPIIMMLLESKLPIDSITVMVQKEAAQRLGAEIGSRDGGAVSVAVNYFAQSEVLFDVDRTSFMPSPNVDSSVIHFTLRSEPPVKVDDEKKFFSVVRAAFAQRRKTALNSICASMGLEKEKVGEIIEKVAGDKNIRAEKLTMQQLADLSNLI